MLPTQVDVARVLHSPWFARRNLLLAAGGLLGLIAIIGVTTLWLSSRQQVAAAVLGEAIAAAQTAQGPRAGAQAAAAAVRGLETALAQHPNAPLAGLAAYELGNLRYAAREYDRAVAAYETALAAGVPAAVRVLALSSIAAAWESRKDHDKAIAAYRRVLTGLAPGDQGYQSAQLDLGRVQELAGHKDEAIETYRQVLKQAPNGARAGDVRWRLASLGASR